jgi:hypothetical protein
MNMKKIFLLLINLSIFISWVHANDGDFAVSKINPALLKNANAVVRVDEMVLEIKNLTHTNLINHYAITILNEKGEGWADLNEYYNKYREINSIEGVLYDAEGKTLNKIKKKDTKDESGVDGGTLMDDSRFRVHNFYYKVYPYTIEYTIETTTKNTLSFPSWTAQGGGSISVEQSSMTVIFPTDYQIRYKAFNYDSNPVETIDKNKKSLTWSAKNLKAIVREPYAPMLHEIIPMVIFGPTDFQMDDYKGNMSSWKDFGKFIYDLKKDRDQLPENIKQTVHAIADKLTDPKEKISSLYKFMQDNTRYISIQLGIGGFQPFPASDVAAKRYGDCKALTNYMYSILQEVGIKSYYTLVRAGKFNKYITPDFPSQQFNHVILCAPIQQDTVWLECTSQTLQAGYLSDFTCDRPVLLVDENGGKLIHTPIYKMQDNLQVRKIVGKIDEKGKLDINLKSVYHGLQQDDYHQMVKGLSKEKLKDYLNDMLSLSMYDIVDFDYKDLNTKIPAIQESLNITANGYATVTGRRMFIQPNIITKTNRKLTADSARKYDVVLDYEYIDIDSVEVEMPDGYTVESVPANININSKFGKYSATTKVNNNKLYYYRTVEQSRGKFPKEDYGDLVKHFEAIYKADRTKVVLVKN